jgi:carboxyl-terminal processing protease
MKKTLIVLAGILIVMLLLAGTFSGGLLVGRALAPAPAAGNQAPSLPAAELQASPPPSTPANRESLFKPFWQVWDLVHDQYVDQPVDDEAMMRGAIRGMLESLGDEHTSYMDPEQYRQANIPLEGEYEGIGAWVDTDAEYLTIVSPMAGSPAEKAGLKPGDQIIAVDGEDMTGIDGNLVIRRVLGPAGTKVILTIRRSQVDEPFDVEVERAKIIVPTLVSKMLDDQIAYVQLTNFGDKTTAELRKSLKELLAQNPKGLILDLRNNPGGALTTAIEVASEFVDHDVIMYEDFGDGSRKTYRAIKGGLATEIPLVVLINEGSASASEIVAGAIQDYARGTLVGMTSFGKGSVQIWTRLANDEGAVRVTVARWLTPKERTIHQIGLKPDVEVPLSEADATAGRDPQLEQAIAILNQK